ncbi:MAG: bis(5'-nucleosyl)-tetraphosphatase (symmetrical) YqeK [Candidatus Margulisbacteria bacterium]|nr:bis(5'-nucleosyl)-tetraphosphatase (symmetrical) YqeK [Candidatus Margulisiibacteriota bacterium]
MKREEIIAKLKKTLDQERFQHSLRVEKTALQLAKKYRVSSAKTSLAALLHDCARRFSRPQMLRQARRRKIKIGPIQQEEPKLLHAELSAMLASSEFGVGSAEILSAIKKHTTGSPKMTKLEKIIYLADHIEEGRNFKGVKALRRLAFSGLDKAVLESASNMLKYLLDAGLPIYYGTLKTRNYYLLK